MFSILKKKEIDNNLYAPVSGKCIALDDVADEVFSSKMMGDGVAFVFEDEVVCAPCSGEVVMIAGTRHAFAILGENGAEVLIHIGLDTVSLNGKGLEALVQLNSKVNKGNPVIRIDKEYMSEKGINLTTPMILTNSKNCKYTVSSVGNFVKKGKTAVITLEK